jgi:hypothetical protein
MKNKTLLINRKKFIDWYFSDSDTRENFLTDFGIPTMLSSSGRFTLTAQLLLDMVGYLPSVVAEPNQELVLDSSDEIDMGQYEEIKFS